MLSTADASTAADASTGSCGAPPSEPPAAAMPHSNSGSVAACAAAAMPHSNSSSVTACAAAASIADATLPCDVPTAASMARLVSMLSTADASTAAVASTGSCGAPPSEPPATELEFEWGMAVAG